MAGRRKSHSINRLITLNQYYDLGYKNKDIMQMSYGELRKIIDSIVEEKGLADFRHERFPDKP